MLPLVSHFIICYNQAAFIAEAMQSALDQDYPNLEVIVADDGSTDGTQDIIREYAEKYPQRLVPIIGVPNLGITGNCNRALPYCKGKYISYQGGDDVLLPGKITAQVEWFEADERRVLCGHDVKIIYSNVKGKDHVHGSGSAGREGVGAGKIIQGGVDAYFMGTSHMWRASAMPQTGFDTRMPMVSDWKFMIDVIGKDGVWGAVDGVFALYRRHSANITTIGLERIFKDIRKTKNIIKLEYPGLKDEIRYVGVEMLYWDAKQFYCCGYLSKSKRIFKKLLFYDRSRHISIHTYKILKYFLKIECKRTFLFIRTLLEST